MTSRTRLFVQLAGYALLAVTMGVGLWWIGGQRQPLALAVFQTACLTAGLAGGLALRRWRQRRKQPNPADEF